MCTFWIHFSSFGALALYSFVDGVFRCLCLMAVWSDVGIGVLVNSLLSSLEAVFSHEETWGAMSGG